jgi:N-acetylneuraminic acid mutarotase
MWKAVDQVKVCVWVIVFVAGTAFAQDKLVFKYVKRMPDAKYGMGYTTDGKYIYTIGGGTNTTQFSQRVFRFDPVQNQWTILSKSLDGRLWTSAQYVPATGQIVLVNGLDSLNTDHVQSAKVVEALDPHTGAPYARTANPYPAFYSGVALHENKVYVFGGVLDDGTYSNRLYVFNPRNSTWKRLADMPEAKQTCGQIADGILYTFGGFNGEVSSRIDAYDIRKNTWKTVGTLPENIYTTMIAATGLSIYLIGNKENGNFLGHYNTLTHEFRKLSSNMQPRRHGGACIIHNKLYLFGGFGEWEKQAVLSTVQVADLPWEDW